MRRTVTALAVGLACLGASGSAAAAVPSSGCLKAARILGQTVANAESTLGAAGCRPGSERYLFRLSRLNRYPRDTVIYQRPAPGRSVDASGQVGMTLSANRYLLIPRPARCVKANAKRQSVGHITSLQRTYAQHIKVVVNGHVALDISGAGNLRDRFLMIKGLGQYPGSRRPKVSWFFTFANGQRWNLRRVYRRCA